MVDQYLSCQPMTTPYHSMRWILSIKKAYRFEYHYLIAKSDNQVVGVLPLCIFSGLKGKKEYCSLPYCDVGGVVSNSKEIESELINQALSKMKDYRFNEMELRQRSIQQNLAENLIDRKVSMLLDLPENADSLLKSFKSKLRSQINKAVKNGLEFDCSNDKQSIDDFFYVFSRNMHILGSPPHSKNWFYTLREMYQDDLLVGRVWFEGKIIGAGILLFSGENVSIPWASTLRDYNRLAPNMMLYWNLLRVSCERGCRQFDFGRSTYGEGTYKFKQQWGAKPVLLDWQILDKQGLVVERSARKGKTRDIIETVWRNLPLFVVNTIGPHLRRHISL